MNKCKSCGASILLLKTGYGKTIPVNHENWIKSTYTFDPKQMVSHFVTCLKSYAQSKQKTTIEKKENI